MDPSELVEPDSISLEAQSACVLRPPFRRFRLINASTGAMDGDTRVPHKPILRYSMLSTDIGSMAKIELFR